MRLDGKRRPRESWDMPKWMRELFNSQQAGLLMVILLLGGTVTECTGWSTNPRTGEETNVIVENTTDRPWYDREYMRVECSLNAVASSNGNSAPYRLAAHVVFRSR